MFEQLEEPEQEPDEQGAGKYLGVIIGVCTLPVMLFFTHIGKNDLGVNIAICLGMNTLAVGMCWDLRRRLWFWCVIIFMLALNVPLVVMIQWPHYWVPRIALLPIGLADMLITVGAVRLVGKIVSKISPTGDAPPPEE
jgi:hypothetical protein